MADWWTYTPCECPACSPRPVYGFCRCPVCGGADPGRVAESKTGRAQKEWAVRTAGILMATEDRRPLTETEEIRLNHALDLLTRSE